ncbi:hypothetical protein SDC9_06457 [bioreactor metagenome]|uniref:Uncharacterized protein n=1 Tax=bioreactor metagenome TaxID=1076179 RepID=A0A644T235_9ZZZZ
MIDHHRPAGGLQRAPRRTDQDAADIKDIVRQRRSGGEGQAINGIPRHPCDDQADRDQHHHRQLDHRFRSARTVHLAAQPREQRARDRADDAEDADLGHRPAQHPRGIDPAEPVKRIQRVAIEHRAEQMRGQAFAGAQRPDQSPQIGHRAGQAEAARRAPCLAHPGEEGDHEDHVPDRGQRPHRAGALAQGGVQAEGRAEADQRLAGLAALAEKQKHDDERDDPADIAEGKARPRDLAHVLVPGEVGHQRIGEDRGEFHPDQADPEPEHRHHQVGLIGRQIPQHPRADHIEARKQPDPDHTPAGAIGDRAEDWRKKRDNHARGGLPPAPIGLRRRRRRIMAEPARHEMRAGDLGEIGAKDEGQQQGIVGLAGPVEEPPAPDPLARGDHARPPALRAHVARGAIKPQIAPRRKPPRQAGSERGWPGAFVIGSDPVLHPGRQLGALRRLPHRRDHRVGRHDPGLRGDGGADQHMVAALAVAIHPLLHIDEALVPADAAGAHLEALQHGDALAVAGGVAGDDDAPAVRQQRPVQPRAAGKLDPAKVEQGQDPAVVQVLPRVDVPGPGDMRADHRIENAKRRAPPDQQGLAHANDWIHLRLPFPIGAAARRSGQRLRGGRCALAVASGPALPYL